MCRTNCQLLAARWISICCNSYKAQRKAKSEKRWEERKHGNEKLFVFGLAYHKNRYIPTPTCLFLGLLSIVLWVIITVIIVIMVLWHCIVFRCCSLVSQIVQFGAFPTFASLFSFLFVSYLSLSFGARPTLGAALSIAICCFVCGINLCYFRLLSFVIAATYRCSNSAHSPRQIFYLAALPAGVCAVSLHCCCCLYLLLPQH